MAYSAPQVFSHPGLRTLAEPQVLPNGHLVDTPEVQAAKAAHFAEVARVNAGTRSFNQFNDAPASFGVPSNSFQALSNPAAGIVVNADGSLADTADVARAKAVHYAALASAVGAPTDQYTRYLALIS